jgi:hypothetical protein
MNIIYDKYTNELSFPSIYYGHPHTFSMNNSVTPYMIVTSEISKQEPRHQDSDFIVQRLQHGHHAK